MHPARFLTMVAMLAACAPASIARGRDGVGGLPVVVLIGDATRLGYAPVVADRLRGRAEVVSPEPDEGDAADVSKRLDAWVIAANPAVVHFDAGLHGRKVDSPPLEIDAYKADLEVIRDRLEAETSARLIFATTTPVIDARRDGESPHHPLEADVEAYNRAALDVLGESRVIVIDDLHAEVMRLGPAEAIGADGVRLTEAGKRALGERVASAIEAALLDPPATREATCRWVARPPALDGRLDDPAWEVAEPIARFPAFWTGVETGPGTTARLAWDDEALYFAATLADAEIRAFGSRRNDRLWNGDVFELFFKPAADRPEYYEFQVNPKSVILELAFPARGADFATLAARPPMGMEAVAVVDGTLDRPGDLDRAWAVEGKIPWSIFGPSGGRPAPGSSWRFALCRFDYGPEGTRPILMSSAPLRRPSFHRYEDYGALSFTRD